jgi:hypothetical protein
VKLFDMSMGHKHYPVRLMIQDACIVLVPSIVMLVGILWFFRKEWDSVGLANFLAMFLPFSST